MTYYIFLKTDIIINFSLDYLRMVYLILHECVTIEF